MSKTLSIIGSDGTLEQYNDAFGDVTEEDVEAAIRLENEIKKHGRTIELSYLKLARDLSEFNKKEYYKARGFESFKTWADSPELSVGYRTAQNLLRVADELMPTLVELGLTDELPPIGIMYNLLPLLNDENPKEKIRQAVTSVGGLSFRDAKEVIRGIRGLAASTDVVKFSAKLKLGPSTNSFDLFVSTPDGDYYKAGTLSIKRDEWPVWEKVTDFIYYEQ